VARKKIKLEKQNQKKMGLAKKIKNKKSTTKYKNKTQLAPVFCVLIDFCIIVRQSLQYL
jgi:hypothetical protein